MNNTLFYLRYAITITIGVVSIKDYGPAGFIGSFIVSNILWTVFEEALIARENIKATKKWRERR